jgi:hypothetical protein
MGRLTDDTRQLIAVLAMAVVAIMLGLVIRITTEGQTRTIEAQGVSAQIPTGWVYTPGAGDLAFTAQDPQEPGRRYAVSRITTAGLSPADAADDQTAAKGRILERFAVLERTTATVGGRPSQRVHYVFVTDGPGDIPQVIEGVDDYVAGDGTVLVTSVNAPTRGFARALEDYERFAATVRD